MALKFNAISGQLDIVLDKASEITYDPSSDTFVTGTNTQDAISELDAALAALPSPIYYVGTWDASTNTPTLANTDTGVEGALYRVNVAGSVDFGAGSISFEIGDSVVNNGTIWEKWDFTDQVISVNSQTGAVVLDTDDVSDATATNKYFTNALAQAAITGGASSIVTTDLAFDKALISSGAGKVAVSSTTATEIGYISGVTSAIQTQLNSKAPTASPTFTGTITTPLTASRALVTGASNELAISSTTATEVGYLAGTTSAVQTQLNTKVTNPMTTGGDLIYGGASGVPTRLANGSAGDVLVSAGGTAAPVWTAPTLPTVQKFTSGSGTYTRPSSAVKYIVVTMVGAGGGGSGSGISGTAGNGGTGGNSTFGTTLLTADGGVGGVHGNNGGTGGASSLGSGPIGVNFPGGSGGSGGANLVSGQSAHAGGVGGSNPLGGAGGGGFPGVAGQSGATNTGAGGGGGGGSGSTNSYGGSGGGAGGYVRAIITSPASTYAYAVGASGTAGSAGTGGLAGATGAAGFIMVEEFY